MVRLNSKRIWDNHKIIGEVNITKTTRIRVELVAKDGVKSINFREWYKPLSNTQWKTYGKGFAMPLSAPIDGKIEYCFDEFQKLINAAIEQAEDFKIHDPEHEVWYHGGVID